MPRHPRIHAPGLLYHLIARGNNRQKIFPGRDDYRIFLDVLGRTHKRHPFRLYAFCLMPNHIHLLAEVGEVPTARIMHALLTRYAKIFNRRHGHRGHVFEGRYKAIVCDRDSYLLELTRYIHLNPVRARLVTKPEDWPWSGHRSYLQADRDGLVDAGPVMGILQSPKRYAAFVREGRRDGYVPEWHPGESAPYLGGEIPVPRVSPSAPVRAKGPKSSLELLCCSMARQVELTPETLKRGGRSTAITAQRDRFIARAVLEQGYQAAEVARFLGCGASNITRAIRKRRDSEVRHAWHRGRAAR